jgi:hypothetical protein
MHGQSNILGSADAAVKITERYVGLDHPLVDVVLVGLRGKVMLHRYDRRGRGGAHYKAHRDAGGWYIRRGKRGQVKVYLRECQITYVDGEPILYQFRTNSESN